MTPKEKAQELVLKFKRKHLEGYVFTTDFSLIREQRHLYEAKGLALIAVDEILNEYREDYEEVNKDIYTIYSWWQEVKQEIENL